MFAACRLTTTRVGLLQGRGLSCSPAALRVSPRAVPRLLLVTSKARVQHPPRRASGAAAARNAAKPAAGLDAAATAAAAAAAAATALASSSTPLWAQPLFTHLQDIQDAVEELQDGVKGLRSSAARQETSLGSIFEVTMRGMPRENRVRPLMRSLAQLLAAVGLPASNGALDPAHAQLAQMSVLHALRAQLINKFGKARCMQTADKKAHDAATKCWRDAPATPSGVLQLQKEVALTRKVLLGLRPRSQPHRALLLWASMCEAAASDAACPAGGGALLALLRRAPTAAMWRADLALLMALVGGCQDELELDMPVQVGSEAGCTVVLVEEVKLRGKGVGTGFAQLRGAVAAIAWLYAVQQQPLPRFVGVVVVPVAHRRAAQERLHEVKKKYSKVPVPQDLGAAQVSWELSLV